MSARNSESPSAVEPSEVELRKILEAAESRKAADWNRKSRATTWAVAIPVVVLIVWAGVFLLQYKPEPTTAAAKPAVVVVPPPQVQDTKDMAQFDSFRPKSERIVKPVEPEKPSGQIVDKGDIEFAMRLLNFSKAADKTEPKK